MPQSGLKDRKLKDRPPNPARCPFISASKSYPDATTDIWGDGDSAVPSSCHLSVNYNPKITQNKSDMTSLLNAESILSVPCPKAALLLTATNPPSFPWRPCLLSPLTCWSPSSKHTLLHLWFLYSILVMGGYAENPETSPLQHPPHGIRFHTCSKAVQSPRNNYDWWPHWVCLINLIGSKKFMHVLSSCSMAFKAWVLLANSI